MLPRKAKLITALEHAFYFMDFIDFRLRALRA